MGGSPKPRSGTIRIVQAILLISVALNLPGHSLGAPASFDHDQPFGIKHNEQPFSRTRNLDLTQQKIIFNPIGQYAVDVTFVHVELKVPFGHYRPLFDEFSRDIEEALKIADVGEQIIPELGKSHKRGLRALAFPVQQAAQRFGEILVKLPEVTVDAAKTDPYGRYRRDTSFSTKTNPEEELSRDKRQIETIIGFGASIVGFVSELFRQREVSRIKQDLTRMERNQNQIMDRQRMLIQTTVAQSKALEEHSKWIQDNRQMLRTLSQLDQARVYAQLASFSNVIQQETGIFADTVKLAQLGELNPDQIGYEQLLKITEYIWDLEEEKDLKSPIGKMADLFSMPLSYLYNLEQERLEFIIHIPLTRETSILDMYEYFPFPMTMTNDRSRVAVPRPGPHNVLAYNRIREFQTLAAGELQGCFLLKGIHYCSKRQILRTDWSKTCLSALYVKDQEAATRYCDFQIQPADERVFKLQGSEFLIYTNRELVAERICGKQHDSIQITEGSVVQIPQGCRMKLEQHQIYGEVGYSRDFQTSKIFDWTWDAQRVLRNHSGSTLANAIAAIEHEAGMSSFETEDVLQQMELLALQQRLDKADEETRRYSDPFQWIHWVSAIISSIGTFVSIMIMGAFIKWLRRRHQANTASAPRPDQTAIHGPPGLLYQPAPPYPANEPRIQFIKP